MLETDDFVVIRFQTEARNKKPVGVYWLQAGVVAGAQALGVPELPAEGRFFPDTYVYSRGSVNGISASANNIYGVFDTGTAQTNSVSGIINKSDVMGSVYLDIPTGTRFVPYIGGGIGYTNISTPSFTAGGYRTASANKGLLGWQGKVGVSYVASYNFDVYAEGVYQGASSFYTGDVHYGSYNSWGAKAGFRYRFGAREEVVVVEPAPAPAPEPAPMPAPEPAPMPAPEPIRGLW
jgi:opacity protein-like surface antigen